MFEYRVKIRRVVDGDTVDVDIDLGFGIWIQNERVRLYGIDTQRAGHVTKLRNNSVSMLRTTSNSILGKPLLYELRKTERVNSVGCSVNLLYTIPSRIHIEV